MADLITSVRANVPSELLVLPQWVCWRKQVRNGKATKVPYNAKTGAHAKSDNPTTWATFEQAAAAYGRGEYDGLGFMFSQDDPYAGVDFDHCADDRANMDADKLAMLHSLSSYAEWSQSGTGAHVIVRGQLPIEGTGRKHTDLAVEMYHYGRFFVMTGDHMKGTPRTIEDRQQQLTALYDSVFGSDAKQETQRQRPATVTQDDATVIAKMLHSKNGHAIQQLWNGDTSGHSGDASAADLALCRHLAYWTNGDASQIDRLFRQSGLYRPKWDKRHFASGETYGQATINKALEGGSTRGEQPRTAAMPQDDREDTPAHGRRRQPTSAEYLAALQDLGYTFTQNELDDAIEVNGQPLNDGMAATIRAQMRDLGFTKMEAMEDAYRAEAYRNRYHPVKRYLESLEWDGQNHIKRLGSFIKDAHAPIQYDNGAAPVIQVFLGKWLIGAVAKVYEGGKVQNPMLVLDGPQNCGKSSLVRFLGSAMPSLYIEEAIRPDDKDCVRYLPSKWVWEVPELGSTTRRQDREALKAFITKGDATFRKPYDRHPVTKPTLASFIGTINNEAGFLTDPTGNRRFVTVRIESIDWRYAQEIDIHQVWAQAYALYKQGHIWQLLPSEVQTRDELNQSYEIDDPFVDMLQASYEVVTENPRDYFVTTFELVEHIKAMGARANSDKALSMDVATACRRMGLESAQRRRPGSPRPARGYYGLRLRGDEM